VVVKSKEKRSLRGMDHTGGAYNERRDSYTVNWHISLAEIRHSQMQPDRSVRRHTH
jgi:hypothetical protein